MEEVLPMFRRLISLWNGHYCGEEIVEYNVKLG
jgi:hypothetical protein